MSTQTVVPLVSEDINIPDSFAGMCDSPRELLNFLANSLIFKFPIGDNIFINDRAPKGEDRGKIWLKTSFPYGIGRLIDGQWRIDYGLCGYPVDTPFLHKSIDVKPEGLKELSDADLTKYGIPKSDSTSIDKMKWYLLESPTQDTL